MITTTPGLVKLPLLDESTALRTYTRNTLDAHWQERLGFSVPHAKAYPWLWLWDSAFHALTWGVLGEEDRAVSELNAIFASQTPDGFVPHVGYQVDPQAALALWGRKGASTLTQPPMYAHAARVLSDNGAQISEELIEKISMGLGFLMSARRNARGLVRITHPWESGADDSPRWNAWAPKPFDRQIWGLTKLELLTHLETNEHGSSVYNPAFDVAPANFNALVAFNLLELGALTNQSEFTRLGNELAATLEEQWQEGLGTWVDDSPRGHASQGVDTLDALLPLLVTNNETRFRQVLGKIASPDSFGTPFGPAGVSVKAEEFIADAYWRGPAWPQLTYLLWVAAARKGAAKEAQALSSLLTHGAIKSNFAEYWNPLTGEGLGASPQSWTGLALVCAQEQPVK